MDGVPHHAPHGVLRAEHWFEKQSHPSYGQKAYVFTRVISE